ILCLTEEMTAVPEEVEEAKREGIPIDYNCSALEILSVNGKVSGLRVINVRNVKFEDDGSISMEQIAGSEFILPAERVIIAIGQKPDSSVLNIKGLNIARNSTIEVDALTLETNLPGIFAGGDGVTGSKDVVSAMAAGLRAAESIHRYLQGIPLKEGRSLELPKPVSVDIEQRKAAPYQRAKMPALNLSRRKEGSLETNLGLTPEIAEKESLRCLDCAGCCECQECEKACEVNAVNLQDCCSEQQIESAALISFLNLEEELMVTARHKQNRLETPVSTDWKADIHKGAAMALKAALESGLISAERIPAVQPQTAVQESGVKTGAAVFLCSCGGNTSAVLDFAGLENNLLGLEGVSAVHKIMQSCTTEGAEEIKKISDAAGAGRVVLASCRCCNWEQVCFSCSDRRIMCQENLKNKLPAEKPVEFVNIREMAAWLYRDNPAEATQVALEAITAGVKRAAGVKTNGFGKTGVEARVLVISRSLSGWSAAVRLAQQGYAVTLLSGLEARTIKGLSADFRTAADDLLKEIARLNVDMLPWPDGLTINGTPGQYEAEIRFKPSAKKVICGEIILDLTDLSAEDIKWLNESNLLSRVLKRLQVNGGSETHIDLDLYPFTIRETAGITIIQPSLDRNCDEIITAGEAAAAQASGYIYHQSIRPRGSAVVINRSLCRGCGDCSQICSLIELKLAAAGVIYADVSPALCLGCGTCTAVCPTGAIKQPAQSEEDLEVALETILNESKTQ
ncbi:MAG TPA: FAD-dependent oxidoreductase, partial [Dehalococcoidales bacterium]|nr:FAD-dependent oxidoreductase [Dehalococcoidales bacterium]